MNPLSTGIKLFAQMHRLFPGLVLLCVLFLLSGCGIDCGGPQQYDSPIYRYLVPMDSTNRITYFAYKDLPGQAMDDTITEWQFSLSRQYTEIYLHSSKSGWDTMIVRCERTVQYLNGDECGDQIRISYTPVIVSHTFDSMYMDFTGSFSISQNEYTYFR